MGNPCGPLAIVKKTGSGKKNNKGKAGKETGKADAQTVATSCTFLDFADNLCGRQGYANEEDPLILQEPASVAKEIIPIPREISFENKTPSPIADYSVLDNMEEQQIVRRQPALLSRIKRKKSENLKIKVYVDKPDTSNRTETENDDYSALTTPSGFKSL